MFHAEVAAQDPHSRRRRSWHDPAFLREIAHAWPPSHVAGCATATGCQEAINIPNFRADRELHPCARAELLKPKFKGPHALAPPRCDRSRMRVRASPCTGDRTRSPSSRRLGYDFILKISVFTFQMVHQGPAGPKVVPNPARLAGRGCLPPPTSPPHAFRRRV